MSVSIGSRVNRVDDSLGPSGLSSTEDNLSGGNVLVEVDLLEGDLRGGVCWLEGSDLLDGESGVESWHVEDVGLGCGFNQSSLGGWVGETAASTGADEEWGGEVVPKDGGAKMF